MRWRKTAPDEILPGLSEERLLRAARDYVASAFPNPERVGCPGRQRLNVLARQTTAPDENDLDHLMTCSDCFLEYQAIRKAWKQMRAAIIGTLVAASVAVIVFSGVAILRRQPEPGPIAPAKRPAEVAQAQLRNALIDLRPFENHRGEAANPAQGRPEPPVLDRGNLLLTILLPIGSLEGQYVFKLVDSNDSPRVETSGNAAIKDYVTTVAVPFDLREVPAGRFTLTVRRAAEVAAASYTVEVR